MLKRFGASSKKRNMGKFTRSTAIVVMADRPETSEDDPAVVLECNKVTQGARNQLVDYAREPGRLDTHVDCVLAKVSPFAGGQQGAKAAEQPLVSTSQTTTQLLRRYWSSQVVDSLTSAR